MPGGGDRRLTTAACVAVSASSRPLSTTPADGFFRAASGSPKRRLRRALARQEPEGFQTCIQCRFKPADLCSRDTVPVAAFHSRRPAFLPSRWHGVEAPANPCSARWAHRYRQIDRFRVLALACASCCRSPSSRQRSTRRWRSPLSTAPAPRGRWCQPSLGCRAEVPLPVALLDLPAAPPGSDPPNWPHLIHSRSPRRPATTAASRSSVSSEAASAAKPRCSGAVAPATPPARPASL